MADGKKVFRGVAGFVQFDVDERPVNEQTVRDVTIRQIGEAGALIRITVWPEFDADDVPIERGDFVAVDGPFEHRLVPTDDGTKEYFNVSAGMLAVIPGVAKTERKVANRKPKGRASSKKSTF